MSITKKEISHIAKLSRLEFNEKQEEMFSAHFDRMLNNFKLLEKINTDGVKPTVHVYEKTNVLRDDIAVEGMSSTMLLANAPESEDCAYLVPKVVE